TAHLVAGVWLGNDDNTPTRKATGGGLPVEIWSRFMKTAHQGVTPAGLPGVSGGGWMALPRADAGNAGATAAPPSPPTLDSWLLDKLFGRR
ncbi:MAG: penicillin-binding protein, partial [Xanthobacteraceae bacterium]